LFIDFSFCLTLFVVNEWQMSFVPECLLTQPHTVEAIKFDIRDRVQNQIE